MTEFSVWPRLCEFVVRRGHEAVLVRPDGFLRVQEPRDGAMHEHVFFLEVDRGSEDLGRLVRKTTDYWSYYQTGGLAKRLMEEGLVPFRVLMVFRTPTRRQTPSIERRNNVAEQLSLAGIKTFVWLTTLEELLAEPLGNIWVTPQLYVDITSGTAFEPRDRDEREGPYLRRPERERFVEERLLGEKLALFG